MTTTEFMEELKSFADQAYWGGFNNNKIRIKKGNTNYCFCPITAVHYKKTTTYLNLSDAPGSTLRGELDYRIQWDIVNAADGQLDALIQYVELPDDSGQYIRGYISLLDLRHQMTNALQLPATA